jgi:hypothetical protein
MINAERRALLKSYVEAGTLLDRCGSPDFPAGLVDWIPPVEDGWTVREHITHFADAEIHSFARFGYAIAEPGTTVSVWEQDAWKKSLDYAHQLVADSLTIIHLIRSMVAARLSALDDAAWDSAQCVHPDRGPLTLEKLLQMYTGHAGIHRDYVERNEKLWEQAKK